MAETARRAFVVTLVVVGVVVLVLALWKLKLVLGLLFLAFTLTAAMRPGVDALHGRRVPRAVGVLVHYAIFAAAVGLFLWLVVPRAVQQVDHAVQSVPATSTQIGSAAKHSSGIKHDLLVGLQRRLAKLPSAGSLVRPALHLTLAAFEALIAAFFVLAAAAYWIFERDRMIDYVCALIPRPKRKTVRDTWQLIDLKLGAYVRGQGLLIVVVGTILSLAFWAIGEPYWILLGSFAGIVEIVPVIGPISAGVLAIGVGLTKSVTVGVLAGLVVLVQRQLEDYLIAPRILGGAVGLSPLLVMVSVFASGIIFGPVAVVLAIPGVAVLTTLFDVIVRDRDPAEEDVPSVLFPAKEVER
jgi:predicted PurR-regulated permease PerM